MVFAAILLGYIYTLRTDIKLAKAENAALAVQVLTAKETITLMQNSIIKQQALLITYDQTIIDTKAKYNEAMQVFEKHDLEFLSFAKPGLIENRVNKATKELFNEIESETSN